MTTLCEATEIIDMLPAVDKLDRDIKKAAALLTPRQVRYCVDLYYKMQDDRKRCDRQRATMDEAGEPSAVVGWLTKQSGTLEDRIKLLMDHYSRSQPIGVWSRGICGIGPVIASGLIAHIDITKCPTVGHIWSFAGYNPEQKWEKGHKRPWNASLKVLCWKIGESFVKQKGRESDVYGKIIDQRKEYEDAKNIAGDYAQQAREKLERFKIGKDTDAYPHYAAGRLPPGHIHARAKRYAVKLFLSHWHEKAYELHFGKKPPLPYPISILGHAHHFGADSAKRPE